MEVFLSVNYNTAVYGDCRPFISWCISKTRWWILYRWYTQSYQNSCRFVLLH